MLHNLSFKVSGLVSGFTEALGTTIPIICVYFEDTFRIHRRSWQKMTSNMVTQSLKPQYIRTIRSKSRSAGFKLPHYVDVSNVWTTILIKNNTGCSIFSYLYCSTNITILCFTTLAKPTQCDSLTLTKPERPTFSVGIDHFEEPKTSKAAQRARGKLAYPGAAQMFSAFFWKAEYFWIWRF